MKKRKLITSLILISLFFVAQAGFAYQSDMWLINDSGEKRNFMEIETGKNLDLGKVRLREHQNTIGLLEDGDKIVFVLTNAQFVSAPIVLDPPAGSINKLGRSGDFQLVKISETGEKGDNAVLYELKRKNIIDSQYRNLDYVFHFNNMEAINEGDIKLYFISGEQDDTYEEEILKTEEILLAKVYNVIPNSISKSNYFTHEIISRDLNSKFTTSNTYNFLEKDMEFEVPQKFFQQGDMLGTLKDERWTFKVVAQDVQGIRVINSEFSTTIDAPIRELKFYKADGFNAFSDVLAQKNFAPIKVTFKNLNPSSNETTKFVPVKYQENSDGTYTKELVGTGNYNHINKSFSFFVNGPGIYTVEQKDATNITMRVNDFFASVNNIQQRLDATPQIINSSTYVPVRFIAENLGAEVEFLADTNQVEIKTEDKTIYLPIDKVTPELSTPARIIEGRTMVPVRYVSEQLGATVTYFPETRSIEIIK